MAFVERGLILADPTRLVTSRRTNVDRREARFAAWTPIATTGASATE
jgi:hypothetical protein